MQNASADARIRAWQIWPADAYEAVRSSEVIHANWSRSDPHYWPYYAWMSLRMRRRLKLDRSYPPLWLWVRYGERNPKPDLRCGWHLPRGEQGVLLTFEIPRERVLLSQFEMWNWVLNGSYIPAVQSDGSDEKKTPQETMASWARIFELDFGDEEWWGPVENRQIQGCTPWIERSEILETRPFVAR
ncbi:DUF3841 domain-containing protein [Rubinisphaera brasiliensis]|uniref:DUF3841 domain-containing protein n=1 Tax=Rubinisphaera brasiliensis (strain ATCC 49424 / DSM 5305 / JCM 21570 / IAM 15109 / NBRC 103401 / IFAM 1448) TaxID=756272 RepID=F0SRA1_RUBBR|nr:DUF3841 domain-containing protein [Rubinisphaera brasiliensis]ADY62352.1 hypothetical protein Plabr_4781 [Rubinisphaera brasiliensis DSM 5305]